MTNHVAICQLLPCPWISHAFHSWAVPWLLAVSKSQARFGDEWQQGHRADDPSAETLCPCCPCRFSAVVKFDFLSSCGDLWVNFLLKSFTSGTGREWVLLLERWPCSSLLPIPWAPSFCLWDRLLRNAQACCRLTVADHWGPACLWGYLVAHSRGAAGQDPHFKPVPELWFPSEGAYSSPYYPTVFFSVWMKLRLLTFPSWLSLLSKELAFGLSSTDYVQGTGRKCHLEKSGRPCFASGQTYLSWALTVDWVLDSKFSQWFKCGHMCQ